MRVESKWTCYEATDDGTACERFARLSCGCAVPLIPDLEMGPRSPLPAARGVPLHGTAASRGRDPISTSMKVVHIFSHIEDGVPMLFAQLSCACVYPITSAMVFDCAGIVCPSTRRSIYGVRPGSPGASAPCEGV